MLLISGNDAATAMAVDTVGHGPLRRDHESQMAALGLHDFHFTTPVGLDDPPHARLRVRPRRGRDGGPPRCSPSSGSWWPTTDRTLPASATHPAFQLHNLNRLLSMYPPTVGVKPGYTGNAGPCLVAEAMRDGHRMLGVLLGAPHLYSDMRMLLDWGFTQKGLRPTVTPPPAPPPARHR